MKTQRQFLSVAWLAAYALLLLSAQPRAGAHRRPRD